MSLIDKTDRSQTETLRFELNLPHAPSKVWRALTDPTLLSEWLLPAFGLELRVGAAFTLRSPPQPGWDGVVSCRVLEVVERERLSYGWVVGDIDTVVTFTLTATGEGTHLAMVHSGFKEHQKQNFGGARYGWNMMGGKLVEVLARLA